MCAAGNDNVNVICDDSIIIFTIKDTRLYVLVIALSARDNQKLSKLLKKGFEKSVCWNKYKIKCDCKNKKNKNRYFLKSNFVGVNRSSILVYSNQDVNAKIFKAKTYYLSKGIINNYNVIINRKSLSRFKLI